MERFKPAAGRLATIYYKQGAQQKLATTKIDLESQSAETRFPSSEMYSSDEKESKPKTAQDILPTGHTFLWQDLSLDLKGGAEEKRLLEKVTGKSRAHIGMAFGRQITLSTGWVKPGEMTALMGVSGAGKVC